jgi:molecular chaperone GrpE
MIAAPRNPMSGEEAGEEQAEEPALEEQLSNAMSLLEKISKMAININAPTSNEDLLDEVKQLLEKGAAKEGAEPTIQEQLVEAIARAEKAESEITYRDADIVNLRRRSATDRADLIKFSGFNLSGRILPVLDSLDKALEAAEEGPLADGVRLTRDNLLEVLKGEGLTQIEVGTEFDPNTMEALSTLPASKEHPDGTIIDTLESGWMYKDRVLRPARVVVSKE